MVKIFQIISIVALGLVFLAMCMVGESKSMAFIFGILLVVLIILSFFRKE